MTDISEVRHIADADDPGRYVCIDLQCGKPAFRWIAAKPIDGITILAPGNMRHLDGAAVLMFEVMRCDSCGEYLQVPSATQFIPETKD